MAKNTQNTESNVPASDEFVKTFMVSHDKDAKALLNLIKYMHDRKEPTYGDAFIRKYATLEGKDLVAFRDRSLIELSPTYGELLVSISKATKSEDGGGKAHESKVKALKSKRNAVLMQFKRCVQALAFLYSRKATDFEVQANGAAIKMQDENGKPFFDILSGRKLAAKGTKLLPQGTSNRAGTGGEKQDNKKALTAALTYVRDTFNGKQIKDVTELSSDLGLLSTQSLIALMRKYFEHDGEFKTVEIKEFITLNLPGKKLDGKTIEPTKPGGMTGAQSEARQDGLDKINAAKNGNGKKQEAPAK